MSDHKPPLRQSLKITPVVDRPAESSSVPMLFEMAIDALQGFANYEERKPFSMSTQLCRVTINGVEAVGLVIVAVYKPEKLEADLAHAVADTLKNLP